MGRKQRRSADLTNRTIANLEHDPKGPKTQVVWDTKVKPLGLRLNPSGRHAWVVNGRKTIGHWPDTRAEDARREALLLEQKPKAKGGFTWRDGLLHYMENRRTAKKKRLVKDAPSSKVRVEQLENRMPFADKPMTATSPDEIADFLAGYMDRPGMHNALRSTMTAVWSHCTEHRIIFEVCPVVVRPLPMNPPRDYFTVEELEELWRILEEYPMQPWLLSFAQLNYIWALRGREILRWRWDYIRGDELETPERKTSGRTAFPIWPEARVALDRLPRMTGCPLIFAPPRGYAEGRTYKHLGAVFSRLAQERWPGRKLTPHTLRRSRATHMRDAGYTDDEIIVLTGHATTTQLRAYLGKAPRHVMDSLSPSSMRQRAAERRR